MNEELQSTNEELETVNTEMAERSEQLDQVNRFRESVLESFSFAVIVLDRSLNVAAWNDKATDLWGLRADEVRGRQLYSLDIGLPVGLLAEPIRACLAERRSSEIVVQATNRTGRTITCEVRCMPMSEQDETYGGVILSMEDIDNLPPARKGWVARRGGVVISMDGGESQAPES